VGSRGQATVELLALLVVTAVVLVAAGPRLASLAVVVAGRLDGGSVSGSAATDRALALASAALRAEPAAPTAEDALVLLGDQLGPGRAGRALDELAARELGPPQVGADPGSPEWPRPGPTVAHVVTAHEEAVYASLLRRRARASARTGAALSLLTAVAALAGPEAAIAMGGAAALLAPGGSRALPGGTRAGDVLLCVPVATPRGDALVETVLRDGRPLRREVERRGRCAG
jgi:hypothetical protein